MVCMVPLIVCEGALKKVAWRLGEIRGKLCQLRLEEVQACFLLRENRGVFTDKDLKLSSLAVSLALLLTLKYPCF